MFVSPENYGDKNQQWHGRYYNDQEFGIDKIQNKKVSESYISRTD
jgi:hypothetical protein